MLIVYDDAAYVYSQIVQAERDDAWHQKWVTFQVTWQSMMLLMTEHHISLDVHHLQCSGHLWVQKRLLEAVEGQSYAGEYSL